MALLSAFYLVAEAGLEPTKVLVMEKLLGEIEIRVKEKGSKVITLNTFSFQAPEFYKKHGYKEVFTLENYPVTGKRHYYTKEL